MTSGIIQYTLVGGARQYAGVGCGCGWSGYRAEAVGTARNLKPCPRCGQRVKRNGRAMWRAL